MRSLAWMPEPPCRILQYGMQIIDERWRYRLHDPFWRMYLNDDDGAWVEGASGPYRLSTGRIHLIPAWMGQASRCRGRVGHHYWHIDAGDWGRDVFGSPVAVAGDLDLFRRLSRQAVWNVVDRLRARALALGCLAAAAAGHPGFQGGADAGGDPVDRVRRHLEAHLAEPCDLRSLAAIAGISPGHLRTRFRQVLGRSPGAWLRERRVAAAAERLISGEDGIDDIATACGFANRFHFTRIFARLVGVGPATYRSARRLGTVAEAAPAVASDP